MKWLFKPRESVEPESIKPAIDPTAPYLSHTHEHQPPVVVVDVSGAITNAYNLGLGVGYDNAVEAEKDLRAQSEAAIRKMIEDQEDKLQRMILSFEADAVVPEPPLTKPPKRRARRASK